MNFCAQDPDTFDAGDYIRMPKPKRRIAGMSRTTLQALGDAGLIEVITVQRPGLSRGLKLIFWPSLINYLNGLRSAQNPASRQQAVSTISTTNSQQRANNT
jgi:hypothetical protein